MGPLKGIKVIEIAGIGPGPFCAMLLADLGADVIRVDRAAGGGGGVTTSARKDLLNRGKRSIAVDLKKPEAVETVLKLIEKADVLTEGFRPGVMERLGLGPDVCLARNPKLVYGRMTGFGQEGPMAQAAGHDINYIALAGSLSAFGNTGGKPVPPLNLVGDFGGGGMFLALGIVSALLEAKTSGKGQVVDTAMVDGAAVLGTMMYSLMSMGAWTDKRGSNLLDSAAHFYDTYETKDGEYISIGSIEPQFYAELIRLAGLDAETFKPQMDRSKWPELKQKIADVFKTKTRAEWNAIMEGSDVCYAPVLSLMEATQHPHNKLRGTFIERDGVVQPAPAPRFSRTKAEIVRQSPVPGENTDEVLKEFGIDAAAITALRGAGAVI
ncbi:CaiB/BaiF CoA transferase family protein [Zavarzinia sp. CC-PAN008]|uniref:CaiB/BaiF CoA transferase family protein n=1 Tax=Zavarzinia sp. CC-PAN008 TaxID=3243332 RepID=UPI003F74A8C2